MTTAKHTGGCHCGALRFEADLDLATPVSRCNCTFCVKRGGAAYIVKPDAFRILGSADELGRYARGGPNYYSFCKRCGIHIGGGGNLPELGGEFMAVNANCLDEIDPTTFAAIHWDGRHDNWHAGPRNEPWPVKG